LSGDQRLGNAEPPLRTDQCGRRAVGAAGDQKGSIPACWRRRCTPDEVVHVAGSAG
jgi:hypothetical protein